jgi:hypothetical protein
MYVTPDPEGHLLIDNPPPDLRYDLGNPRLFATLDGQGQITHFHLPEGISVIHHWAHTARLNGVPIKWTQAEAIGRSFTLRGSALDVEITLCTVCPSASPELVQVWYVTNRGGMERVFTLTLDVVFDLSQPVVRVGTAAPATRLYHLLSDNLLARRALGPRRWRVLNRISEAQKRLAGVTGRAQPEVRILVDGLKALGAANATLRAGDSPLSLDPTPLQSSLSFRQEIRPGRTYTLPLVLGANGSTDPACYRAALDDADQYAAWLTSAFEHPDPVLRSLYAACLNTALAMYKELPSGFAGLWAGPGYAYPPRIYFRDSYWTGLILLPYRPDWVRNHLLNLATGIHPDGTCPSGVIDRAILPFEDQDEPGTTDWLSDHRDSPAYFVLLLHEVLAWTGDMSLLNERLEDGRTIWMCAQACLNALTANPAKDRAPNDWADNVLRSEWVTYDLALLVGALHAAADIARNIGESNAAATYAQDAYQISQLLQIHNWDDKQGYYVDYRRTGENGGLPFVEDHLALDTLMTLRFHAAPPERAARLLEAIRAKLQTRYNMFQPYEDWGMMCCWPPYRQRADLFGKSAQPYHYHNGAEWPYLSAAYAQLLLERDDPGWRYPLTRWWEVHLSRGWLTPVEYHSPAHPPGAFLQGWSGLAVSAMLVGGLKLRPALNGKIALRPPPWGPSVFRHLIVRGQSRTITVTNNSVQM